MAKLRNSYSIIFGYTDKYSNNNFNNLEKIILSVLTKKKKKKKKPQRLKKKNQSSHFPITAKILSSRQGAIDFKSLQSGLIAPKVLRQVLAQQ